MKLTMFAASFRPGFNIGVANIYLHHPPLQDIVEYERLLKLMVKSVFQVKLLLFLHYFVILNPLCSNNRLSHFPGPVTKFRTKLRAEITIYRKSFSRFRWMT